MHLLKSSVCANKLDCARERHQSHTVLLWEDNLKKALTEIGLENEPNWECLVVHRKTRVILNNLRG